MLLYLFGLPLIPTLLGLGFIIFGAIMAKKRSKKWLLLIILGLLLFAAAAWLFWGILNCDNCYV